MVMHSFGMRIADIRHIRFELCVREKKNNKNQMNKKEKKDRKKGRRRKTDRKKEKNNIEIFTFNFSDCEEKYWHSGAICYVRITKGFHL